MVLIFRNTDKKRRERLALKKALGGSCREPRKQIKVVSTAKKRRSSMREMQLAPAGQIPLPRRGKFRSQRCRFIDYK